MWQTSAFMQTEDQEQIYSCSSQMYSEAAKYIREGKTHCFGILFSWSSGSEIVTAEGNDGRHLGMGEVQECA